MRRAALAVPMALIAHAALADGAVTVSDAWSPPAGLGEDVPLYMTITNSGAADALLRARCTAANFAEAHTVDHGEGFPAMRTVKSIPIEAEGTTTLRDGGPHVMLLQTRQVLTAGGEFTCSLTFRDAGKQDVPVKVGAAE